MSWLPLALAGLVTLSALGGWTLYTRVEARRRAAAEAQQSASRVVQFVAREQERLIQSADQLLVGLAQRSEVRTHNIASCSTLFAGILKAFPGYLDIAAVMPAGEIFCAGRSHEAAADLVEPLDVRRTVETGNPALGPYTIDRVSGKGTIVRYVPSVDDAGVVQAVVIAALDLTWLTRALFETPLGGASLVVVDRNGVILTHHPEPEPWTGSVLEEPIKNVILGQGEGTAEGRGLDGRPSLFVFAPLLRDVDRTGDAVVLIALPQKVVFRDADRLFIVHLFGLGIVALLLLVTTGMGLDRLISRLRPPVTRGRPRARRQDPSDRTEFAGRQGGLSRPVADSGGLMTKLEAQPLDASPEESVALSGGSTVESYWGLAEAPFENSPNPKFLYLSPRHEQALVRLVYAVKHRRGAAMLTGEYGCGKTTLVRALLQRLEPERYEVGLLTNPRWDAIDFLRELLYQMGVDTPERNKVELVHMLNHLFYKNYRAGRDNVIIVDEAQLIEDEGIFEDLRLLLNFQLDDRFLVTLLLIGSPELRDRIARLPHLEQRITIRSRLSGLDDHHTANYIAHRLKTAGQSRQLFTDEAVRLIFAFTRGIPREINNLCDTLLFMGYRQRVREIDKDVIRRVMSGGMGIDRSTNRS